MDAEPQRASSLDSYGLPLITFPVHPTALPIFAVPSQKAESVGSVTEFSIPVPSIAVPLPATEPYSRVRISELTTIGDISSLGVPSRVMSSPSPSIPRPNLNDSKPTGRLPSLTLPSSGLPSPTLPTSTPPIQPPFFNNGSPTNLTIPSLHPAIPDPPFHPSFLNNTATNLTTPLPQTYNTTTLIANATRAIQVLEILIDIATAGAETGVGIEDKDELVRTLLEAVFPLLRGFVDGGEGEKGIEVKERGKGEWREGF